MIDPHIYRLIMQNGWLPVDRVISRLSRDIYRCGDERLGKVKITGIEETLLNLIIRERIAEVLSGVCWIRACREWVVELDWIGPLEKVAKIPL